VKDAVHVRQKKNCWKNARGDLRRRGGSVTVGRTMGMRGGLGLLEKVLLLWYSVKGPLRSRRKDGRLHKDQKKLEGGGRRRKSSLL